MAAQRLAPDAILAQTNLSGSVTAIQDDPDSPDTSWLTCPDNTSNTSVHVSFPTPSAALTGTQEARVRVRPTTAGTNAGTASVDVLVGGVVIASSSTVTVSATQVVAVTFNASLVSDRTGLEVRVNGTSAGGKATSRKSVEVGAIELNATVVESVPAVTGSGGVVFPFSASAQAVQRFSGAGGASFGWSIVGDGTYTPLEITGSGGVTFTTAFDGSGTVESAAVTGSGGVGFGFATEGAGEVVLEGVTGNGGVSYGFSVAGEGTYTPQAITVDGGVAFGFASSGAGTVESAGIAGSGAVTFGFTLDGGATVVAPEPEPAPEPEDSDGPWISHGVVHLAHPPRKH